MEKPKLAICVYHKPHDLWEIPKLILKLNPSYKFYLRQHNAGNNPWEISHLRSLAVSVSNGIVKIFSACQTCV